jgi:hypothetical protein
MRILGLRLKPGRAVFLSMFFLRSLLGSPSIGAEGTAKKFLSFDSGSDRAMPGWTYRSDDPARGGFGPSRFMEEGTPRLFRWYSGDFNGGPDYGYLEIDNTRGALGTPGSLKYTITGGKNVGESTSAQPVINGGEIRSKEEFLAFPGRVGTGIGGSLYSYFMRGGVQIPEATGADRFSLYLYVPKGWTMKKDGHGNYTSHDLQLVQNHCDPAQNPCTNERGSNSEGEPTTGESGHFYHFLKIGKGGGWVHVLLDQHPQHERTNSWDKKNNPTARDAVYGFKNYYDTVSTFYIDQTGTQLPTPFSLWVDEMEFYHTATAPEPNQNDDSVSSVTVGYFPEDDGLFGIGFQGYDTGLGTWEIRYATSPITNATFNSAAPIQALSNAVPGNPGRVRRLTYDDGYPAVWTTFDLPAELKAPGRTLYFAIKDVSQQGQHRSTWVFSNGSSITLGDSLTAANPNIHTIDYNVLRTPAGSDNVFPSRPKGLRIR